MAAYITIKLKKNLVEIEQRNQEKFLQQIFVCNYLKLLGTNK